MCQTIPRVKNRVFALEKISFCFLVFMSKRLFLLKRDRAALYPFLCFSIFDLIHHGCGCLNIYPATLIIVLLFKKSLTAKNHEQIVKVLVVLVI